MMKVRNSDLQNLPIKFNSREAAMMMITKFNLLLWNQHYVSMNNYMILADKNPVNNTIYRDYGWKDNMYMDNNAVYECGDGWAIALPEPIQLFYFPKVMTGAIDPCTLTLADKYSIDDVTAQGSATIVTFKDGSKQKVIRAEDEPDNFDYAVTACIAKQALSWMYDNPTKKLAKMVEEAHKRVGYLDNLKAEQKRLAKEEAERKRRKAEKRLRKKVRREARKQLMIHKEYEKLFDENHDVKNVSE